ncbi:MAG: hypothetical protein FWH18_12465 [Marinilabiliaceae bacterium]|nr:hypothetical protein [Marinilabiliaceae bacterium]
MFLDKTNEEEYIQKGSFCQSWYGITDSEDNEEGIYTGEELVENAVNALKNHYACQIFKNCSKEN